MTAEIASGWRFVRFGLIVTGAGEREFLPQLFRSLMASGHCTFRVLRRVGQRAPITSPERRLRMVGAGKEIPDKDVSDIGFPTRAALRNGCDFVALIDDLEYDRSAHASAVFERYRRAVDSVISEDERPRVAVHFLVMMLEAYYFADATTVNAVLGTQLDDHDGDVETIRHPKAKLKRLAPGFDEKHHGAEIVARLDVLHVLSCPDACASLRTLFAWCVKAIGGTTPDRYQLANGAYYATTRHQIDAVGQ